MAVTFRVDILLQETGIHLVERVKAAFPVNQRLQSAFAVNDVQRGDSMLLAHPVVIGAKCGCDVDNAGPVFGGHKIAGNHPECISHRPDPVNKLFIMNAFKRLPGIFFQYPEGDFF